jgi:hypothetical protein
VVTVTGPQILSDHLRVCLKLQSFLLCFIFLYFTWFSRAVRKWWLLRLDVTGVNEPRGRRECRANETRFGFVLGEEVDAVTNCPYEQWGRHSTDVPVNESPPWATLPHAGLISTAFTDWTCLWKVPSLNLCWNNSDINFFFLQGKCENRVSLNVPWFLNSLMCPHFSCCSKLS